EKKAPSVFPLRPCCGTTTSETYISVGCLVSGYLPQPVKVQWNSGAITRGLNNYPATLQQNGLFISSSQLTIPVSDWEKCKEFKSEPTVQVMQASCGDEDKQRSVDLVCLITGYTPQEISVQWLLNGNQQNFFQNNSTPFKEDGGTFASTSKVSISKHDWNEGDSYTCKVTHPATGSKREDSIRKCSEQSGDSSLKIAIQPPTPEELLITMDAKVKCVVSRMESVESLSIKWSRNDNKKIIRYESTPLINYDGTFTVTSTLKISPQDWDNFKKFTCKVEHSDLPFPIEKWIIKNADPGRDPTVYVLPPSDMELRHNGFASITCVIKDFSPKDINILWKKNGENIQANDYITTDPIESRGDETYLVFSILRIRKTAWEGGATFSCVVLHNTTTKRDIKKTRGKK
ncbi:hypothetical protein GDO86_001587, partial [Hymenochirus boettgeri]